MWLLVVSQSSDYWLGISPRVTLVTLVDVEVCLGIPLCVTRWVPRGSRGLILGITGRGAPHSCEHWKGGPLFVSRQCFPNKLTSKQVETNIWYTLCVDLIGPYMIPRKGKNLLKFWRLTMIDPATTWFEMAQIPNKTAAEISDITEKTWFNSYLLPQQIMFDRSTKFIADFAHSRT